MGERGNDIWRSLCDSLFFYHLQIALYSNYSTEAVLGEITVPNLPNLTPYYITIQLTYSSMNGEVREGDA